VTVKYVLLIHSNPQPWGHPTADFLADFQALPSAQQQQLSDDFERLLAELHERGELIGGEALGDPASSTLFSWRSGSAVATDGPYSETKEHFAGFFLVDVATRQRAEEIAAVFAGPGETVELRPVMGSGADD
jgi:hypothetical protein